MKTATKTSVKKLRAEKEFSQFLAEENVSLPLDEKTLWKLLFRLVGCLSPEEISGDGEYSAAEVRERRAEISRLWCAIEKRMGKKVSLEEAENRMLKADPIWAARLTHLK